ncbi:nucleotidyltransferase domain-containing protein [Mucilaginibacter sp. HMF5004]|uniref:nucleotidyltransferase domain-containing protein n=1 Tax=Mucilaginibacter rivuli TaxID=2857527 RepID=UPI001C5ED6B8|nr:nucleotidyltransferase domain-containing protein [Mucilaginibacter rivuli]MBW4891125.1 nucleotidyltransferase domain-containing protein [Mucilaginibacter rivuli]
MKFKVLELGDFVKTNDENYLINTNSLQTIKQPFLEPISDIVNHYCNIFKNKIHSIYLRGSVARGKAIINFSDYDCFAILEEPATEQEIYAIRLIEKELLIKYKFVSNFDLYYINYNDLITKEDYSHWIFTIEIQSVFLFGNNLINKLSKFRPNKEIAFAIQHLEISINKASSKLQQVFEPSLTKYWCSWICRKFVRCGLELVIEQEKQYTNELFLCYKTFSKYYPDKKNDMELALNLSINPTIVIEDILSLIKSLGHWLIEERIRKYSK